MVLTATYPDLATTLAVICFIGVGVVGHKGEKPVDSICEKEEGGCSTMATKPCSLADRMNADLELDDGLAGDMRGKDQRRASYGGSVQKSDGLITPPDTPMTETMGVPATPPRQQ